MWNVKYHSLAKEVTVQQIAKARVPTSSLIAPNTMQPHEHPAKFARARQEKNSQLSSLTVHNVEWISKACFYTANDIYIYSHWCAEYNEPVSKALLRASIVHMLLCTMFTLINLHIIGFFVKGTENQLGSTNGLSWRWSKNYLHYRADIGLNLYV